MRDFSGGYARTTVGQNIVLRWVRDESVYDLWKRLKELGARRGRRRRRSPTSSRCPGTDSCKLGITSSMGLNAAINRKLLEMEITDPLSRRIHIKILRLPERLLQHHIANIGFYGASIKVGEHTIPAYVAHIGGVYEGGEVGYGQRLKVRLPAKRVPDAVERWIRIYEAERTDERGRSTPSPSASGRSASRTRSRATSRMPVEFGLDTMNMFIDWDRKQPSSWSAGRGRMRGLSDQLTDTLTGGGRSTSRWSSSAPSRRRSR